MAIIGQIKGCGSEDCMKNMSVGSSGFMDAEEILTTYKGVFIALYNEILQEDDLKEHHLDYEDVVKITRIGPGLTENDFELDFSQCTTPFCIESFAHGKNEFSWEEHIVFKNGLTIVKVEEIEANTTPLSLEEQLKEAEKNQDYEQAQIIRDRIEKGEK